jgi:hypothetical protein
MGVRVRASIAEGKEVPKLVPLFGAAVKDAASYLEQNRKCFDIRDEFLELRTPNPSRRKPSPRTHRGEFYHVKAKLRKKAKP